MNPLDDGMRLSVNEGAREPMRRLALVRYHRTVDSPLRVWCDRVSFCVSHPIESETNNRQFFL
jgi:hypothetical protein